MKTKFISISLIFLLGYLFCPQPAIAVPSSSKALPYVTACIEEMNNKTGRKEPKPRLSVNETARTNLQVAVRQAEDQEAEKQKIAQVISSVIGWAKDKNLDLFFSSIAQDGDFISVTPGNRVIKRFEDVKQNVPFWMSPDFKYVRHELKDLEIKFARCGEVAWFYCVLDDINTYKGEPASWENTRWTGVVEKRDGRWVVVQQHFSFASDR